MGRVAQAWLLDWMRGGDPDLSASLHDTVGRKPYTISPLIGADDRYALRITSLRADVSERFDTLLRRQSPSEMRIEAAQLAVEAIEIEESSYAELVREATETIASLALRFITPTTFHSNRLDVPLPLPALVFGSLIHAWDSFSPLPLPIHLATLVGDGMAIADCQLRTRRVTYGDRGGHVGFTGYVRYSLRRVPAIPSDDQAAAAILLGALIRYARFAGVGVGTAAGMGQVMMLDKG